jgi:putative tricarboxylic transport membrane protein
MIENKQGLSGDTMHAFQFAAVRLGPFALALPLMILAGMCPAAEWKPERGVEIVAPSGAGGSTDRTARVVQRILQERKLVDVPVTVTNKPGGSGTIGLNYLNQHVGDGHYLIIATTGAISNHIMGLIPYNHNDFTALAMLFDEYLGVTVKMDSPLRSGRELAERLRKDPEALSIGISTSVGGANHTALMVCLRAAGINIRRLKTVVFPGGAASTTALLGGHVDAINTAPGNIVEHIKAGKLRVLALSSPQRLGGLFATVPTWREQGVNADSGSWRGMMGPKGMTPQQIAYWDRVFAALVRTDEWKKDLEENYWENSYADSKGAKKRLDEEYAEFKAVLGELGYAK